MLLGARCFVTALSPSVSVVSPASFCTLLAVALLQSAAQVVSRLYQNTDKARPAFRPEFVSAQVVRPSACHGTGGSSVPGVRATCVGFPAFVSTFLENTRDRIFFSFGPSVCQVKRQGITLPREQSVMSFSRPFPTFVHVVHVLYVCLFVFCVVCAASRASRPFYLPKYGEIRAG